MIIEQLSDEKKFTATEKKVIEFIQEHPRVVTNLSLLRLASLRRLPSSAFAKNWVRRGLQSSKFNLHRN